MKLHKTNKLTRVNSNIYLLLFFVLVFIQIGFNLFLSFGTVGLLGLTLQKTQKKEFKNYFIVIYFFFIILVTSLTTSISFSYSLNLLQEFRVLFLFAFLIYLNEKPLFRKIVDLEKFLIPISVFFLILVIFQFIFPSSRFLFLKDSFYYKSSNLNYSAVTRAIEYGYKISLRPSAFYTEPSYLGMVCCCLFAINTINQRIKYKNIISLIIILIVVLSRSSLGILGLVLIIINTIKTHKIILISLSTCMIFIILNFDIDFFLGNRLNDILSIKDASTIIRFTNPIKLILSNINDNLYFGIPRSACATHFTKNGILKTGDDFPFHNSILNLLINYGFPGIYIIFYLFKTFCLNKIEVLILFICMCQNGDFFSYDKVFVITLTFALLRNNNLKTIKQITTT